MRYLVGTSNHPNGRIAVLVCRYTENSKKLIRDCPISDFATLLPTVAPGNQWKHLENKEHEFENIKYEKEGPNKTSPRYWPCRIDFFQEVPAA